MAEVALNARGSNQLTVDNTAGGVPLVIPTGFRPRHALLAVTNADIRWLASGTPTATVGTPVSAGGYIDWTDPNTDYTNLIVNARFIRTGGTSAIIEAQFFD